MEKNKSYKLCQKCFKQNSKNTIECSCGSTKFAPEYVKRILKINRQFSVQITEIAEQFRSKNKPDKRITLYKWWPGKHSTTHINNVEEWNKIKNIIDIDLGPFLGWKTKKEILDNIKSEQYKEKAKTITENYPEFVNEIIKNVDFTKIEEKDISKVSDAISALLKALNNADDSFVNSIKKLIGQLPKQGKRAIEDLSDLLNQWTLRQITAISSEVKHRLETIDIFNKSILNDKTYEIRGNGSVHRILENAMWIIDERYWLMHSNETLRTIVGDQIVKTNKSLKGKRPDFVCGTVGNKMIIVEIKRPSHDLTTKDLEQLETYMLVIEQHSSEKYLFEGYLVGKKISIDLEKRLKFRGNQFKVKTYSDLIDDVKNRYSEYYKSIKK